MLKQPLSYLLDNFFSPSKFKNCTCKYTSWIYLERKLSHVLLIKSKTFSTYRFSQLCYYKISILYKNVNFSKIIYTNLLEIGDLIHNLFTKSYRLLLLSRNTLALPCTEAQLCQILTLLQEYSNPSLMSFRRAPLTSTNAEQCIVLSSCFCSVHRLFSMSAMLHSHKGPNRGWILDCPSFSPSLTSDCCQTQQYLIALQKPTKQVLKKVSWLTEHIWMAQKAPGNTQPFPERKKFTSQNPFISSWHHLVTNLQIMIYGLVVGFKVCLNVVLSFIVLPQLHKLHIASQLSIWSLLSSAIIILFCYKMYPSYIYIK